MAQSGRGGPLGVEVEEVEVVEVVEAAPSLGLRLGLRPPGGPVTTRPWAVLRCSIRSPLTSPLGQYGHTTWVELGPAPLAPAPGVAASVAVEREGDVAPEAAEADGWGLEAP
ncbi:hypothetical protein EYF80_062188 [Liparis tanakae]|uniref:Uncharacterized protein n=1 Tax=Liparis tanakae TaxID=230148 RepID=A0A4Z2EFL0_9TELE|nr:hypothetical protein EYF80_062188 [Liparis tanakae]